MNKQPEQTAKTRAAIIQAFLEIASDKGISGVTVASCMKRCGYNRGTFYEYFTDVEDIVSQIEAEIIEGLREGMSSLGSDFSDMDFQSAAAHAAEFLSSYDDRIFILISSKGDPSFLHRIEELICDFLQNVFEFPEDPAIRIYLVRGYAASLMRAVTCWKADGKPFPVEHLSKHLQGIWFSDKHLTVQTR